MATRSEQYRAEQQRRNGKGRTVRKGRSKPGAARSARTRAKKPAGRKAPYALEPSANASARPSRRSTRASNRRAKPDSTLDLVEEIRKGSPQARYRKQRVRTTRVRGSR